MARTDLNRTNGWVKEEPNSEVLTAVYQTSAVEAVARKVNMTSETMSVPRFEASGVSIVAEGAEIPVQNPTLDEVTLKAVKFADRFQVSIEDTRDSHVDFIRQAQLGWAHKFARTLDNATLGVTAAQTGVTVPYTSVYNAASTASRVVATAGDLTYEDLNAAFSDLEQGNFNGDLVLIAHPAFAGFLRNLKDAAGDRVVAQPLGAGVPTVFGYEVRFSAGARTSAAPTDSPTGNPLLIVANRRHLILGVRDGIESMVSDDPQWSTDVRELKMRARRGFVPATAEAFYVIEKTNAV